MRVTPETPSADRRIRAALCVSVLGFAAVCAAPLFAETFAAKLAPGGTSTPTFAFTAPHVPSAVTLPPGPRPSNPPPPTIKGGCS